MTDSVPAPVLTSLPVNLWMVELFPVPVDPTYTTHLPSLLELDGSVLRRFLKDILRTNFDLEGLRSDVRPMVIGCYNSCLL